MNPSETGEAGSRASSPNVPGLGAADPEGPEPHASGHRRRKPRVYSARTWVILVGLLLVSSTALRVWYASGFPHIHRFEDEQYSLQNVRKIFHTGDFEPASGYYPSPVFNYPQVLTLRAFDWLAEQTGRESLAAVGENGRLLPTGVRLTRYYQTLCGVLTLLLLFLVGRRLFQRPDPRIGLLAATAFAFMPWAIHSSGYNKPDALLVMGVVGAFWMSIRAIDGGRASDYVLAGVFIAIAMGGKLTGGLASVPITVGTLFFWRRPRRLALLALAGTTSAVTFVLTNPYWRAYLHFIRGLQKDYSGRTEASPWQVPLDAVRLHLASTALGPVLGALALVALVALVGGALAGLRRAFAAGEAKPGDGDRAATVRLVMFLAFPLVYTVAYGLQTSYFKPNNFLPVLPFSALALGWLLVGVWDRAASSVRRRPSVPAWVGATLIPGLAWLAFASVAMPAGVTYAYRSLVPTTFDMARGWLAHGFRPRDGRLVYEDAWAAPGLEWEGAGWPRKALSAWAVEDDVATEPLERLRLADGLILRREHAGRSDAWVESLAAEGVWDDRTTVEPRLFRVRGPALTVTRIDWRRRKQLPVEVSSCGAGCWSVPLEAGQTSTVFTLLPRTAGQAASQARTGPTLHVGGDVEGPWQTPLPLRWASRQKHGDLWVSPKVPVGAGGATAVLRSAPSTNAGADPPPIQVHRWHRPSRQ